MRTSTFQRQTALAITAFLGWACTALADPIPVPLPGDCSSYPDYDGNGNAGPWLVRAVGTDGGIIDNHGAIFVYSRGPKAIRWGYLAINDRPDEANTPLRCVGGYGIQAIVPTGVSGSTWEDLVIQDVYPYDAMMMYFVNGSLVEPYKHVVEGREAEGVYLGSKGVTKWAFSPEGPDGREFGKHWVARLLLPGSEDPVTKKPLKEDEIVGFLKVG